MSGPDAFDALEGTLLALDDKIAKLTNAQRDRGVPPGEVVVLVLDVGGPPFVDPATGDPKPESLDGDPFAPLEGLTSFVVVDRRYLVAGATVDAAVGYARLFARVGGRDEDEAEAEVRDIARAGHTALIAMLDSAYRVRPYRRPALSPGGSA